LAFYVHGFGHFHPENEITNKFLEELDIGTNDEWIMERVGIRSRRTILPLDYIKATKNVDVREGFKAVLYTAAEMGRRAAEMAIARAGISKDDVKMVVSGSSVGDTLVPAEACNMAAALEIEAPCFDVRSACTSVHAGLFLLSQMDPAKVPEYVLFVSTENTTPVIDYQDRSSAVLWGDASVAIILSTKIPSRVKMVGNTLNSSPAGHEKVVVPRAGHFVQEGRAVQKFAISKTILLLKRLQEEYQEEGRTFNFVGHQANLLMLEQVCKQCAISPERHFSNMEWYGNTATAGSPSVISMNWDRWKKGDDIGVVGVGAGLTWSSYLLRFEQ
jgi:3-oxoacyl-[acyl-carrier-protein] synthase III